MNMTKKLVLTGICVAVVMLLSNYAFAAGPNDTAEVHRLEMKIKSVTMKVNQDKNLSVSISPGNAGDKTIVWASSDTGVVTVYDRGGGSATITSVGEGSANVTATSSNGKTAVCRVTVSDDKIEVRRLEMVNETTTVRVNQERTLLVEVVPRDADNQDIEWSSSNSEVVMVEGDGVIIGITPGTAEITATSHNGKTATCTVTVPSAVLTGIEQQVKSTDIPLANVNGGEVLGAAVLRLQVENAARDNPKEKTITLTYSDKTTVSTAALRSAAFTATYNNVDAVLRFRTLDQNGNIQGQLTIHPENAGAVDQEIRLSVYTNGEQLTAVQQNAATYFKSPVAVVRLTQKEEFGMPVEVAAKVDLTDINTQTMNIYRYVNGVYIKLDNPELRVNNNGFLHFTASEGGTYIIV